MSKNESLKLQYMRLECIRIACDILGVNRDTGMKTTTTDEVLEKSRQIYQWVRKTR